MKCYLKTIYNKQRKCGKIIINFVPAHIIFNLFEFFEEIRKKGFVNFYFLSYKNKIAVFYLVIRHEIRFRQRMLFAVSCQISMRKSHIKFNMFVICFSVFWIMGVARKRMMGNFYLLQGPQDVHD